MLTFDVRSVLAWGGCAMLIGLLVRNPFVLIEMVLIVMTVRATCVEPDRLRGIGWMIRVAPLLLAIGVIFNLLTVRSGDRVILTLPEHWPLIGGAMTLNALAYGVVSALGLFVLLLTGTTVAAMLRWIDLTRMLPQRFASLAVSGSVAWVYLPELTRSFTDIRESLELRGMPPRGPRTLLPLIVPLLGQGLERAMTTAEVLEARGFGGARSGSRLSRSWMAGIADLALIGGLVILMVAAYIVVTGGGVTGLVLVVVGIAMMLLGIAKRPTPSRARQRTRYRIRPWRWTDSLVMVSSFSVCAAFVWRWSTNGAALGFNPYPIFSWPPVDLVLMAILPLLLVPAALVAFGLEGDR